MHILTVDVEDWFHILDNAATETEANWQKFPSRVEAEVAVLLDLFDRHNQTATFFILGWIARNYPDIVAEIANRGHEIASHSDMHQLVYKQSPDEFERDLVASLAAIEKACGIVPTAYRAPGFSITQSSSWAFDILARNGIGLDCSVFPENRAHGGIPGFPEAGPCTIVTPEGRKLKCFPISLGKIGKTTFVFSGGGYFRLAPKVLLRRWFRQSEYIMTYFHPRDFDPGQPVVPGLSMFRRFKSYVGLHTAYSKLDVLLNETDFMTLGQADTHTKWDEAPVVQV